MNAHKGFRMLTGNEVDFVAGGADWIDENGNGVFDEGDTIVVTANRIDSGGQDFNWGWAAAGAVGGVYIGSEFAGAAAVGITVAVEYGVIGASTGAALGPVGVVAGAVIGVAAGYVIYEYGPEIWENTFGSVGTESSPVQNQ